MSESNGSAIRAFISYSHDSDIHKARVLEFSEKLRSQCYIDAWIDQYEQDPVQGWPRWMLHQIQLARFVLVVCTKNYRERFEGMHVGAAGKGARWEGAIISQEMYDEQYEHRKFIPVLMDSADENHCPTVLRSFTRYDVSSDKGFESLFRLITGQPEVVPAPLGKAVSLPLRNSRVPSNPNLVLHDSGRLTAVISISASASGLTALLEVANIGSVPVFLEPPKVVFMRPESAIPPVDLGASVHPRAIEQSSEIHFLPVRPFQGPLQPTERRKYFLPYDIAKFLASEHKRFEFGPMFVQIDSGAGEELRLDDESTAMVLKSLIGSSSGVRSVTSQPEKIISDVEMQRVIRLIQKRTSTEASASFKVFPPAVLLNDPALANSPDVAVLLKDKSFCLKFSDGEEVSLSLVELMVMTHQLIFIAIQMKEIVSQMKDSGMPAAQINLKTDVVPAEVMIPEMISVLLSKLEFEKQSSEEYLASRTPVAG
jgi:hypothetical protein